MWIKLCGIKDLAAAQVAAELRVDAIGLNFYAKSPRCVAPETAREIGATLPASVLPIGLFVDAPTDEIVEAATHCRLRAIQLHGDESPEQMAEVARRLPGVPLVRAFRVDETGCAEIGATLSRCAALGVVLKACLIDARVTGAFGGTGHVAPWDVVAREFRYDMWPPLILAGGLGPHNVGEAIRAAHPWGVDVSSGIESAPGVKDAERMRAFVAAARAAAAQSGGAITT